MNSLKRTTSERAGKQRFSGLPTAVESAAGWAVRMTRDVDGRVRRHSQEPRLKQPHAVPRLPRASSSPAPGGNRAVIGIDITENRPTTRKAGQKSVNTIFG
jgi:hypothetical protein